MSSILKVDTIQDQNGNLIISKDSGGSGFLSPYASSSAAITYTVTVASKTSAHPYFGVGSSNGYLINGIESPIIEIKGNDTSKPYHYKFDQSDSSNSGHPLLFYNNVGKTTGFSTGVTTNGTPGQAGAYTMIAVDSQTPNILYYQCSSHANMGNHTFATSPVVNTGVFLTLPTADGSSGQVVTTNGSGVLSFANGSVPDDAITLAKMAPGTDGNLITYDTSGNPAAVATGSAAQVLTSAGAGAVPSFQTATVPDDAITLAKMAPGTDGNIISYDASGNPVAVATGNDGQVLTSTGAGSPPAFETLPGGGSLDLLATTTISNLSSISFDSSLITDTYKTYKAIVENLRTTADSVYLYWQLSSDNGSSYLTSGYSRMIYYIDNQGSGGSAGGDENKPGFYLNGSSALGNAGREALNSEITFFGLRSSTTNKSTFHTTIFNKTNAYPQADLGGFHYSSATVMNNLKLLPNSGNLSTGTVKFYGVR